MISMNPPGTPEHGCSGRRRRKRRRRRRRECEAEGRQCNAHPYFSSKRACVFLRDTESRDARVFYLIVLWKMLWSLKTHRGSRREIKVLLNYSEAQCKG